MQRTLLVLAFGLLSGGIIGAYATTTVYGKRQPPPKAKALKCPACAECAACPPPQDCDAPPPVVIADDLAPVIGEGPDEPADPTRPGLPASAIQLASTALARELGPCRTNAQETGAAGTLLLDLTITATVGVGHIRTADVVKSDAGDAMDACVLDAVARVQFQWAQADGESKLRYPVRF